MYIDQFDHRIAGIPCQIGVTHFFRQAPWKGSAHTAPSDMDYYGYTEMEYDILDRRGRPTATTSATVCITEPHACDR